MIENIIYKVVVGSATIAGVIANHFKSNSYQIPDCVFGWDNPLPTAYVWLFIVNQGGIKDAHEQCKLLELRNFIIVSDAGMIAGG